MATYRIIAPGVDIPRRDPATGAKLPNLRILRPTDRRGRYTDSDAEPTLMEWDETCAGPLDRLVARGALVPVAEASAQATGPAPEPAADAPAPRRKKGGDALEDSSADD